MPSGLTQLPPRPQRCYKAEATAENTGASGRGCVLIFMKMGTGQVWPVGCSLLTIL